jgi:predicted RNA-binding protein with PUA-like domain
MKNFWLVKQEPSSYSWSDFVRDRGTSWTGVRNYTARNNLRRMGKSDEVLFYHSGEEKAVVGIAKVTRTAYQDPTAKQGRAISKSPRRSGDRRSLQEDWSTVDLAPLRALRRAVTLRQIKDQPRLKKMQLVRQSRLSVMPVTAAEFQTIVRVGK